MLPSATLLCFTLLALGADAVSPIGRWIQKPHGWWCPLHLSETFELWTGHLIAGGYCSRHWHENKRNAIIARDAVLQVTLWGDEQREVILGFGERLIIEPGIQHRFRVLQSGCVWEWYAGHCDPQDIMRLDTNGWEPPQRVVVHFEEIVYPVPGSTMRVQAPGLGCQRDS